ncbi:MAG: hypothetical protein K6U04_10245, partial [Armatimonadetes bacterium]|nr:hypothetical protein [Armatimonadota bacterium]
SFLRGKNPSFSPWRLLVITHSYFTATENQGFSKPFYGLLTNLLVPVGIYLSIGNKTKTAAHYPRRRPQQDHICREQAVF